MHDGPVLFAYDGSDDADRAIDVAFDLLGAGPAIVVGSRGLTGVHEAFEGSVSHQVAEHAGRPVLIVPPSK